VTWATCVPILVFLGLSVLDLGPNYATDPYPTGGGTITSNRHFLMTCIHSFDGTDTFMSKVKLL